jgi:hypothetical protein
MKKWRRVAEELDPPIPAEDLELAAAAMARVEAALRPLVRTIPLTTEPAYASFCLPEEER